MIRVPRSLLYTPPGGSRRRGSRSPRDRGARQRNRLRDRGQHRHNRPAARRRGGGKGGRIETRRLAPQAILRVCEKRGWEAGIPEFAAHDLRRTYISALLDHGIDLSIASDLAGHNPPTTTKRYDRRGERARHAAAAALSVPFIRS